MKSRNRMNRQLALETLQNRSLMAADLVVAGAMDFGDAPDTYGTTLESDGARHVAGGLRLGKSVDVEMNGQPSGSAKRDGLDEDGVRFLGTFAAVVGKGVVDAWADTNGNGRFESSEKFIDAETLYQGENYFPAPDAEYYRFRVSEKGGLDATGFGGLGEVEDYRRILPERHVPEDVPPIPPHNPGDPGDPADPEERDEDRHDDPIPEEDRKDDPIDARHDEDGETEDRDATLNEWIDNADKLFGDDTDWIC